MKRDGWKIKPLLSFAEVCTGKHDANYATENGKYRFYTCAYEYMRCDNYRFNEECLILPGNGANVGEVFYYNGPFDAYQRTYVIYNIRDILPRCLYYHFLHNWKTIGVSAQYGAATNYIKIGNFIDYKVIIPPLPEQSRIVEELDLLSNIIEKKRQQLSELDNLAQSIFYDMFGDPVTNEKGWEVKAIKEVAPQKPYKGDVPSINGKYWLLNLDMIVPNTGEIIDKCYFEKEEIGNSTIAFDRTNVLYSKLRPYLNKVVIPNDIGYATTELVPLCPLVNVLNREFLAHLLRSYSFVSYINDKVAGAKMPRVSMDILRAFPVILPPLSLQQLFSQKIEAIEKQKALIKQSITETEELFNSRMDYYFS